MKSTILLALMGTSSAVRNRDAPAFFNEPTWKQNWPSAAGLVQLESPCKMSGGHGVTCGPSDAELFAVGMNGDEDLGQDITMKGQKFHYNQRDVTPEGKNCDCGACPACNQRANATNGNALVQT